MTFLPPNGQSADQTVRALMVMKAGHYSGKLPPPSSAVRALGYWTSVTFIDTYVGKRMDLAGPNS